MLSISQPILFERQSGIYAIIHVPSSKCYVGSAVNFRDRWRRHYQGLIKNCHINPYLQSAWNKYGEDSFEWRVLEFVDDNTQLIEAEQHWIDYYQSFKRTKGYNIAAQAGNTLGFKFTEEARLHNITRQQGERSSKAIFSDEQVLQIKLRMQAGEGNTAIAKSLGVKVATITAIRVGKSWKHIQLPGSPNLRCQWPMLGSNHPKATLDENTVREIKQNLRDGESTKSISLRTGINKSTIGGIKRGRCWKNV